jgi:hypothetical protein
MLIRLPDRSRLSAAEVSVPGPGIVGLLAQCPGVRLGQPEYQEDFGRRMGLGDGADSWKIKRLQAYDESGFPSWEAFLAGDWEAALALIEAERAGFARFYGGFAARGASFRRVRIVEAPVSAYVQWELAEAAVDVVRGARVLRVFEDVLGGARLDDAAGLVGGGQEERAVVRDPLCLLHVVGDDDDRDLGGDLGDGLLDAAG